MRTGVLEWTTPCLWIQRLQRCGPAVTRPVSTPAAPRIMAVASQRSVAKRMTLTDVIAIDPASTAGAVLRSNLAVLAHLGGSSMPPKTGISLFDVPDELKTPGTILLVGSPAGNGQGIRRIDADPKLDNVSFKEAAFYSLCYHTPPPTQPSS